MIDWVLGLGTVAAALVLCARYERRLNDELVRRANGSPRRAAATAAGLHLAALAGFFVVLVVAALIAQRLVLVPIVPLLALSFATMAGAADGTTDPRDVLRVRELEAAGASLPVARALVVTSVPFTILEWVVCAIAGIAALEG